MEQAQDILNDVKPALMRFVLDFNGAAFEIDEETKTTIYLAKQNTLMKTY